MKNFHKRSRQLFHSQSSENVTKIIDKDMTLLMYRLQYSIQLLNNYRKQFQQEHGYSIQITIDCISLDLISTNAYLPKQIYFRYFNVIFALIMNSLC